jgi:hypothetical protein
MKSFFAAMLMAAMSFAACSQKLNADKVPGATKNAFEKAHPGSTASWEKEDGNYEVNFTEDGKTMSCVIDKNGTILETEADMAVNELPAEATKYLSQHYKNMKVKEASKIVKRDGAVNYEAFVNKKDVIFDANGRFIKIAND